MSKEHNFSNFKIYVYFYKFYVANKNTSEFIFSFVQLIVLYSM